MIRESRLVGAAVAVLTLNAGCGAEGGAPAETLVSADAVVASCSFLGSDAWMSLGAPEVTAVRVVGDRMQIDLVRPACDGDRYRVCHTTPYPEVAYTGLLFKNDGAGDCGPARPLTLEFDVKPIVDMYTTTFGIGPRRYLMGGLIVEPTP